MKKTAQKSPLEGLLIRTAIAITPTAGNIYACDPKRIEEDIPHTIILAWRAGVFHQVEANYNAHTVCITKQPEFGVLDASEQGFYSIQTRNGVTGADIIENSRPPAQTPRLGGIRSVAEIAGKAYAVGLRGMVYRLDELERWTRIDDGLPDTFDIQAIHGFAPSELYAVGRNGQLWRYDGNNWTSYELPTNVNLYCVKCAGDDEVYVAGHEGVLIRGRGDTWRIIPQEETGNDIWDIEWFDGKVFISTMGAVYRINNENLEAVDFGDDPPKTYYQLSAAEGVMWSNGETDIMSFDGNNWTRIV